MSEMQIKRYVKGIQKNLEIQEELRLKKVKQAANLKKEQLLNRSLRVMVLEDLMCTFSDAQISWQVEDAEKLSFRYLEYLEPYGFIRIFPYITITRLLKAVCEEVELIYDISTSGFTVTFSIV